MREHIVSPSDFATRACISNKEDHILNEKVQGDGGKFLAYYVKKLYGKSTYIMMGKNKRGSSFIGERSKACSIKTPCINVCTFRIFRPSAVHDIARM